MAKARKPQTGKQTAGAPQRQPARPARPAGKPQPGKNQAKTAKPQPADNQPKPPRLKAVRPSGNPDESFFELVHNLARQIPRGRVTTYGAIAAALGTKGSSRMVGWALISGHHAQPFVPCHRVVNRIGLLTGRHHYTPPEQMQELLEAEGIQVEDNQVVEFTKRFWDPSAEL